MAVGLGTKDGVGIRAATGAKEGDAHDTEGVGCRVSLQTDFQNQPLNPLGYSRR